MTSQIINITQDAANKQWQNALAFCEQWKSGANAFEITTSGSTGTPKQIAINRAQMEYSARQTNTFFDLQPGDNLLIGINTAYIGGIMMLVRGLINDMNIYIQEPSSNPLKGVDQNFVFTALVPLQIEAMIAEGEVEKLNKMKAIIVGGAPISNKLLSKIQSIKTPVYSTYGMTETVSHIALKRLNGAEKSDYFNPLGDIEISTDSRDCLTLCGTVTNHKQITTNDVVELASSNHFEWLGRHDNIINSGGIKINPEQVECKLAILFQQLDIPNDFFVHGQPDDQLGEKVELVIEGTPFDDKGLLEKMKTSLPAYHHPKNIRFVPKFKHTATGKIKRKESIK